MSHFSGTHPSERGERPTEWLELPSNYKPQGNDKGDSRIQPWMQRKPSRTVSTPCCRKRNAGVADITAAVPTPKRLRRERRTSTGVHPAVRKLSSRLRPSPDARFNPSMPLSARQVPPPSPASH